MDFCPQCGTRHRSAPSVTAQFCRKCQHEIILPSTIPPSSFNSDASHLTECVVALSPDVAKLNVLPTTRMECPKCSHDRAHYRTLEIWDDEGDTLDIQIYRCTKCKHTWREKA
jgi:DNA-directed RNA polymerase subunit M